MRTPASGAEDSTPAASLLLLGALQGGLALLIARAVPLCQRIQERALPRQALRAFPREPLHAGEDRLRVQVRLGDDVRFQPTGEPLVVLVGGERIGVGQRTDVAQG